MTQVIRIGFAVAVMALASASASALAQSDSATAGNSSAIRGQAGNTRTAMLDKADVVARNGEGSPSELGGASRSAPTVASSGGRSETSRLAPADNKRTAKWSYLESLTEFLGFEGGAR